MRSIFKARFPIGIWVGCRCRALRLRRCNIKGCRIIFARSVMSISWLRCLHGLKFILRKAVKMCAAIPADLFWNAAMNPMNFRMTMLLIFGC